MDCLLHQVRGPNPGERARLPREGTVPVTCGQASLRVRFTRGLPVDCPWIARGLPLGKQVFECLRRLDERPLRRDERLICPLVAL